MSENLNRSTPDFSKYDSMSIGELEEILRADALGPERDNSDVDEILYVMEVLAKKRRQNGIAGKTALEAYQEFQQHYLPGPVEESKPRRKSNVIPFKRIATVAASLVLVFSLATTANAFCFKDVWNAVVNWAQETFCFSTGVEVSEPHENDALAYTSIQEALVQYQMDSIIMPTYIPDGYALNEIIVDQTPKQTKCVAIFLSNDKMLRISVQSFLVGEPEQVEKSDDLKEIYSHSGIDYYIFNNYAQTRIAWITGAYECHISSVQTGLCHLSSHLKGRPPHISCS